MLGTVFEFGYVFCFTDFLLEILSGLFLGLEVGLGLRLGLGVVLGSGLAPGQGGSWVKNFSTRIYSN